MIDGPNAGFGPAALLTAWTFRPVEVGPAAVGAVCYLGAVRTLRRSGRAWAPRRTACFGAGLIGFVAITCGPLAGYESSLFWVWTTQVLMLLLVVPIAVMAGQPVELAVLVSGARRRAGARRIHSALTSPVLGPAVIPLISAALFFGPLPGLALSDQAVGALLPIVVLAVGCVVAMSLVGVDENRGALAIGAALAVGMVELLIDAVPGIVLRLQTSLSSYFHYRTLHPWSPRPLRDQQMGGAILWSVAELADLPFLAVIFVRWARADAKEAAIIDAALDAQAESTRSTAARETRGGGETQAGIGETQAGIGETQAGIGETPAEAAEAPWWLSDPAMRGRFRQPPE